MKKLFGQFLVENGAISETDLLAALMEQLKLSPTIQELVYGHGLLTGEQILKAFALEHEEGLEFRAACQKLGFWNERLSADIVKFVKKARPALGTILVDQGKIKLDDLTKFLDEFLSLDIEATISEGQKNVEPPTYSTENFNPTFAKADAAVLAEYTSGLSTDLKNELTSKAEKLSSENISEVAAQFRNLEVLAAKSSAMISMALFCEGAKSLENQQLVPIITDIPAVELAKSILLRIIDMAWEMRGILAESGTEQAYWQNEDNQTRVKTTFKDLDGLLSLLPETTREAA